MSTPLTPALARLAAETLDDVFTPDGIAVTITAHTFDATQALVSGREVRRTWYYVDVLTASRGLLGNARSYHLADLPVEAEPQCNCCNPYCQV